MEMNFCRRCGSPLTNIERHVYRCENGHILFANSSATVGIWLVNSNDEILVATRGIEPFKGDYDTIGGFVDEQESLEQAVSRELQEELGITTSLDLHYLTSGYDIYPYGGEAIPLLNVILWARIPDTLDFTVADDVAAASFMPIDQVPLARIHHNTISRSLGLLADVLAAQK